MDFLSAFYGLGSNELELLDSRDTLLELHPLSDSWRPEEVDTMLSGDDFSPLQLTSLLEYY